METGWRSPRGVEEDMKNYLRKRFEEYMGLEDSGLLTRALAITALRQELEYES